MPRKKSKKNMYFHEGTEKAIIRYNNSTDPNLRNTIYNEHIRFAFEKLAENLIHTFKFYYFDVSSEDVKHEVVSNLVSNIHKFKEGKGKAFSYFSIVAKNYLILHNNNNYKRYKQHKDEKAVEYGRNLWNEHKADSSSSSNLLNDEFTEELLEYWEKNLNRIFKKPKDIKVADSVLELIRRRKFIENFNKKALYLMIREMTSAKTQHITRVVNVMKKHFKKLYWEYSKYGGIDLNYTGSIIQERSSSNSQVTYNSLF